MNKYIIIFSLIILWVECLPGDKTLTEGNVDSSPVDGEDHTLHSVFTMPEVTVDFDGDQIEVISASGGPAHTHDPNSFLTTYVWYLNDTEISQEEQVTFNANVGYNKVCLQIGDDKGKTLTSCQGTRVVAPSNVPGALIRYAEGSNTNDGWPDKPKIVEEVRTEMGLKGLPAIDPPFVATIQSQITLPAEGATFKLNRGIQHGIRVNGQDYDGSVVYGESADVQVWVQVNSFIDLPAMVRMNDKFIPQSIMTYKAVQDDGTPNSFINSMYPNKGPSGGGTVVTLNTNLFPKSGSAVYIGLQKVPASFNPGQVKFTTPAGVEGEVEVFIQTQGVMSNVKLFTYVNDTENVQWERKDLFSGYFVRIEYCFGFIFTAEYSQIGQSGTIKQWAINEDFTLTLKKVITAVPKQAKYGANTVLGLTCDPTGTDEDFKLYLSHGKTFYTNPIDFFPPFKNRNVPYTGFISYITIKDNFKKLHPVISGLPVSNWDHSENGGFVLDNGSLVWAVGGSTNAGYPAPYLGGLPDSFYQAALLIANPNEDGFPVDIKYKFISGQTPKYVPEDADPNNAIYGDCVLPDSLDKVKVLAEGLRNPFDCALTMKEQEIWCTDNGANEGFGPAMMGCTVSSQGVFGYQLSETQPYENQQDKLIKVKPGEYHGHPNMARVRASGECGNRAYWTNPRRSKQGTVSPKTLLPSSVDGIIEYQSQAFGGQLRGSLMICKYKSWLNQMSSSGKLQDQDKEFPCLDLAMGPGGALYGADLNGIGLHVKIPVQNGPGIRDCMPNRGKAGISFTITGKGLSGGTVMFGPLPATIISTSDTRIIGKTPKPEMKGFRPVVVTVGENKYTMQNGFKYI